MSHFKFEGEIQTARKRQLDFISEVLEKKGFKGSKVIIEPVGKVGDNYMANVKRIVVTENGKTFKMIAKLAPDNQLLREMAGVAQFFQNENFMYTEVLPKFDQKQKSAGIPENERFRFAKCYGALSEEPNEVILLEDLKEHNFEILNRYEPLKHENVKMVLRNFAIYHALSYVVRYQEPETYAAFQKILSPLLDLEGWNERSLPFFTRLEEQAVEIADARCTKYLKGALTNAPKYDLKIRKLAKGSKHTVIQQGDAWTNNIMFRLENESPVECVMVDYQMVRENSPVFDLMYMLFSSTTHKQRSKHFHEYIDYYHNELDKALNNFGLKANLVFPRDRLDADLKSYGKIMFASALITSSIVSKNQKEAEKMKEVMELTDMSDEEKALDMLIARDEESLNMFRTKVEDLADSFSEFGLI